MASKKSNKTVSVKQLLTFVSISLTNGKTFVGIPYAMTGETDQEFSVTILSKGGMLTFDQTEVADVVESDKETFDLLVVDIQPVISATKTSRAKEIYKLNVDKMRRCDVIRLFMKELNMSEKGASTYFQNIRKSLK